jgi:hypothetical protein
VTLIFRTANDVSYPSSFFVDDVQVVSGNSCVVSADAQDVIEPPAQDSGEDIAPSTEPKPQAGENEEALP